MAALEKRALTTSEIVTSSLRGGSAGAAESCGEPFKEPGASEDLRNPRSGQGCSAVVGRGVARWWGVCSVCASVRQFLPCHKGKGESRGGRTERPGGRDTSVELEKIKMPYKF